MANVTIYLSDDLAERVKRSDLPTSRVCQRALRAALAARGELEDPPADPDQVCIYDFDMR